MARKLRLEEEGAVYHVLNRGNYRQWIFGDEGAKLAFEATLFEACERAGWVLHAFCILGNHYHLAVETPRANLTEGMRWLQSVYANRFNRFRGESGHLFQGRFKSLLVEDTERLGWLCHYIHLNPVRAEICKVEALAGYRWSSAWYLGEKRKRPAFLDFTATLSSAGGLADTPEGRQRYGAYLAWLSTDQPAQKQREFARMSWGWAVGSKAFQQTVAAEVQQLRGRGKLTQAEARAARALQWEMAINACLTVLRKGRDEAAADRKSADWKVAIAGHLKQRMLGTNRWLSEHLNMGTPFAVSRYVAEMTAGRRPGAQQLAERLSAKVKH